MTTMYVDDVRTPTREWDVVSRSSKDAIDFMEENGCPDYISFDHDLGGYDNAIILVRWMIENDLDADGTFIPLSFGYGVHSANPVGAENIRGLLDSYLNQREVVS